MFFFLFAYLYLFFFFFFFNATATTEIYTLSLHDALPISLAESMMMLHEEVRASLRSRSATSNPSSLDRKSTRLNSSHVSISYAVFCLKKKKKKRTQKPEKTRNSSHR